MKAAFIGVLSVAYLLGVGTLIHFAANDSGRVAAVAETVPVPSSGDAADDAAIWLHPSQPGQSTIIATDKKWGLLVYDLAGHVLQGIPGGRPNNVDVRYNFPLDGGLVDIVVAGDRSDDSLVVYQVDPQTGLLTAVPTSGLRVGLDLYGLCLYHSQRTGQYYAFVTSKSGDLEQWELLESADGQVTGAKVRGFDVGSQTEACVADDELGYLYVAEEADGIWKYGAEPDAGPGRVLVDATDRDGHLAEDVEGLSLYYASGGTGYLIAASQGNDRFVIYRREGANEYVLTFAVAAAAGVDAVSHTDGIDVVSAGLGQAFPQGLLVVQDNDNGGDNQNFKLVAWPDVARSASPPLAISTNWDPRHREAEAVVPSPTPTPDPDPTPASTPGPSPTGTALRTEGIWISPAELAQLPMYGPAWDQLQAAALAPLARPPDLTERNQVQVQVVAKALYYARTGDSVRRDEVRDAIALVIGSEHRDALGAFWALGGWVIAADLIDLQSFDPELDATFRAWLRQLLDEDYLIGSMSLVQAHELLKGGNNWGTAAGFSRAAIAVYLGDEAELARTAQVFKGYLGDRDASDGDSYTLPASNFGDDLSWQCDRRAPVGINPKGCTKQGHSIDGVLPDDQRRGGRFRWPPPKENYVYTGLQGVVPQAVILYRAGYDVWNWEDQAILRAFNWLYDVADFPADDTDDRWMTRLIDYYYCTDKFHRSSTGAGRTLDWTDWTHPGNVCEAPE